MKSLILAAMAIALLASTSAFARPLKGTWVLELSGFDSNDGSHSGEIGALGLVKFNSETGTQTGNINFTSADSGGDQAACTETVSGTGQVASDGTGTLSLAFSGLGTSSGTMNFKLVRPSPGGNQVDLLQSDSGTLSLTICGEPINTIVLKGHLRGECGAGNDAPC